MAEAVISVVGLRKSYGAVAALAGIDLDVNRGEVFAFLGPNGAGKTTTVEILEGYRRRDGGEVSVLGTDPARADRAWRERIGVVLQQFRLQPELTVREMLELYGGYYRASRDVGETIALVGLDGREDVRAGRLSGGQQRRLDVGLALIGDPELLFLDEPTTGFDPSAWRQAWEMIANLRGLGKTVLLTTHYMDEAQALADRAAIIVGGRIVAMGAPSELGGRADAAAEIAFRLPDGSGAADLPAEVASALVADAGTNGELRLRADDPVALLHRLTAWALEREVDLLGLEVRRPTLEDVYLELTEER